MPSDPTTYDVVVVGAGPAGLVTAGTLARAGVRVLVVERHAGTSIFPKATGVSLRSMELFRSWGIDEPVRAGAMDVRPIMSMSGTLADPRHMTMSLGFPNDEEAAELSPARVCLTPQDHVEPVLADHLLVHGGRLRFDTEFTGLAVDGDGVTVDLHNRGARWSYRVRARYVVGADGPGSTVRDALGIGVDRLGKRGDYVAVLFRADLSTVVGERRYALYAVGSPESSRVFVPAGNDGRWIYGWQWRPESGESVADVTPREWTERIRASAGAPDLQPEIIGVFPFEMVGAVATAYRAGNAGFLVGDAAHRMTPVGGTGMNTAIAAGHNLGWKLAWVLRGWAGPSLLDSYEAERRPTGTANALRSLGLSQKGAQEGFTQDLGVVYESPVIATDVQSTEDDVARPGGRAPHAWVRYGGQEVSTLDLFRDRLTLLAGRQGDGWTAAARQLAATGDRLPLAAFAVGREVHDVPGHRDGRVAEQYGIADGGAALVRPDGHVAWRSRTSTGDPAGILRSAVDTALGRATLTGAIEDAG